MMTPTLVTLFGGSGFLGRHIVRQLCKDGYRVRVCVRNPNVAHFLKPMGMVGQVQVMQANVKNEASVEAAIEGADHVINLVGILHETGRQKFEELHADAPGTIGRIAAAKGVKRYIQMSALGANAESDSRYAATKAQGEAAAKEAFPDVTILRPSVVFGPEDDFFNKFAGLSRFTPALPLIGGGKTRFQPLFVGDLAKAVAAALKNDKAKGRTYELGGPEVLTMKEIMELTCRVTGHKRLLVPLPFGIAMFQAAFLGLLPKPILTMDQVILLKADSVPGESGDGEVGLLGDLIPDTPCSAAAILPSYLYRFRRHGQYAEMIR